MHFIKNKELGLKGNNVINISLQSSQKISETAFKEEVLKNPDVICASINSYIPSLHNEHWGGIYLSRKPRERNDPGDAMWIIKADKDFFKTLQINILEGEDLIASYTSNETPFIINESAARLLNDEKILGHKFTYFDKRQAIIIGIVQDFHFRSLHNKVEPTAILLSNTEGQISVRLNSAHMHSAIDGIRKIWKKFEPDLPLEYFFLNADFDKLYKSDEQINKILIAAGILSLVLSCLGIFSITAFTAKSRTKEIGIRKINGSTTLEIMFMLSKDFTKWVVLAFIIACPFAWYAMNKWLQNFAYKTELSWWIFVAAGFTAMTVAVLTVSWQSWRAAMRNPVEALRYE